MTLMHGTVSTCNFACMRIYFLSNEAFLTQNLSPLFNHSLQLGHDFGRNLYIFYFIFITLHVYFMI